MTEKIPVVIEETSESKIVQSLSDQLINKIHKLEIIDDETDALAKSMMSEVASAKKELKKTMAFLVDDHKVAIEKVSAPIKERIKNLDGARSRLDDKVIDWDDKKRAIIRKEELKLQKAEDAKEARRKEKIEKEAAEREISVEEVEAEKPIDFSPPKMVEQVKKTVKTEKGSVTIRRKRVGEVVDASLLPREYLKSIPDQAAIDSAVLNGVTVIRGVKIWDKPITSARGR